MIRSLDVRSIRLLTNNPAKIDGLTQYGVTVKGRQPHVMPANPHNRFYLETKASRSGHWIDFDGKPHLPEQNEPVVIAPATNEE
jgi:GTP cyclohydrolase II